MGVVALRSAAMLLVTVRSPSAKKTKGIALLNKATNSNHPIRRRGGRVRRLESSTGPEERSTKADADERDPKGREALDGEADEQERRSPDSGEEQQFQGVAEFHGAPLRAKS